MGILWNKCQFSDTFLTWPLNMQSDLTLNQMLSQVVIVNCDRGINIHPKYFYIRLKCFSSHVYLLNDLIGCGDVWYPDLIRSSVTQFTLPVFPPPLLQLNLSTSPTSVCVLLWKVLLGYRQRKSADINTGEAPCWVCCYQAVPRRAPFPLTLSSCLEAVAGGLVTHPKHKHTITHRRGTWTGRMHGHGSTCGSHIQHVCFLFCRLFVLHKRPQSCHHLSPTVREMNHSINFGQQHFGFDCSAADHQGGRGDGGGEKMDASVSAE